MRSVLQGLSTATKPGGTLLLHGYTPQQVTFGTGGPPNPEHMYTQAMLREIYHDLNIAVCEEYLADLDEGLGHSGRSALIDFIGKRLQS